MPELFTTTSTIPKVFNVSSNSRSTSAPYEGNDRVRTLLGKGDDAPAGSDFVRGLREHEERAAQFRADGFVKHFSGRS